MRLIYISALKWIFALFFYSITLNSIISQSLCNRALDFDGVRDFVEIAPLPAHLQGDLQTVTIEMWFVLSSNNGNSNCSSNFKRLISFGSDYDSNGIPQDRFEIGECGGVLNFVIKKLTPGGLSPTTDIPLATLTNGDVYCISIIRNIESLDIYLNGVLVFNESSIPNSFDWNSSDPDFQPDINFEILRIGDATFDFMNPTFPSLPPLGWDGLIDEFRFWSVALQPEDLCNNCSLLGDENGLEIYWTFDQGIPDGDNTNITQVLDKSLNGNHGTISPMPDGHLLNGGTQGNFTCSFLTLGNPDFSELEISINEYGVPIGPVIQEICSGDLVHLDLLNAGADITPTADLTVNWEYRDVGDINWTPISDPNFQLNFSVGANHIAFTIDCSMNSDGFVEREFRANITETNSNGSICQYRSQIDTIKICCPITEPIGLNLMTSISVLDLCEGDIVDISGNLILDPNDIFVPGGSDIIVDWSSTSVPIDQFDGQISFNLPGIMLPAGQFCITATIQNCACPPVTVTECFKIDQEPKCGLIKANLDPTGNQYEYEICPGTSAVLSMSSPFLNCNPVWQYSFTPNLPNSWVDIGLSNSGQNTNILPGSYWPSGASNISYRIKCLPLSTPSGCDPCYSNELTIVLKPAINAGGIIGNNQICAGASTILKYDDPQPGYSYQWYCNGVAVGIDNHSYSADQPGCYTVEITDGCYLIETVPFCLTVCEIFPVISCPLSPNECVTPGQPIFLSACDSYSSCSPNTSFIYKWTWPGGSFTGVGNLGCNLTDIPDQNGTTYTLIITDPLTGCMATDAVTVFPCI